MELILEANSPEEVEFNKTFDIGEGGEREIEEVLKEREREREREGEREGERRRAQRERVFVS